MIYRAEGESVPVRRSLLWVSGNDIRNMDDAPSWGADVITLDLEDTVMEGDKPKARKIVVEALRDCDFGTAERWVRFNGLHTSYAFQDLEAIIPALPEAVRLPKCRTADDVRFLDRILGQIERESGIEVGKTKVILNIENALAVVHLFEIASASTRTIGIVLGGEDFTKDLKIQRPMRGLELPMLFGRQQLITVARAVGIQAFDSVYLHSEDLEGLRQETQMVKELGMDGKNVHHPRQVPVVNEVFKPTKEEIDFAVRAIQAYGEAAKTPIKRTDGTHGGPYVDGRYICVPGYEKARQVVLWAKACGISINF